ncbi:MAG: hypothetical protein ABJC07_02900 [Acidobacteriota bacterium]
MRASLRVSTLAAAAVVLLGARSASASLPSDFQARLAQTVWAAQRTESMIRALPQSSTPVSPPDGLSSYGALLAENVTGLTALATVRLSTDEQRRVFAEGLQSIISMLHDQTALATNRGLSSFVSHLSSLEESCRTSLAQIASQKR